MATNLVKSRGNEVTLFDLWQLRIWRRFWSGDFWPGWVRIDRTSRTKRTTRWRCCFYCKVRDCLNAAPVEVDDVASSVFCRCSLRGRSSHSMAYYYSRVSTWPEFPFPSPHSRWALWARSAFDTPTTCGNSPPSSTCSTTSWTLTTKNSKFINFLSLKLNKSVQI